MAAGLFLSVSGPIGTYNHIFVLYRLLRILKWDFLFIERSLTITGHSLIPGE
jgi:hypothetical protein